LDSGLGLGNVWYLLGDWPMTLLVLPLALIQNYILTNTKRRIQRFGPENPEKQIWLCGVCAFIKSS
jgi:hypothetical protein